MTEYSILFIRMMNMMTGYLMWFNMLCMLLDFILLHHLYCDQFIIVTKSLRVCIKILDLSAI